jgi:D-alanyl-D-alanine carboxypeptidase
MTVGSMAHLGPGAHRVVPIASVAKVMTAYVVLRDHPLSDGEAGPTIVVRRAEAAAYPGQRAQSESLVEVETGERITERQALEALWSRPPTTWPGSWPGGMPGRSRRSSPG